MSYLDAIILAVIEGLTEFLPVSSTGHMIIASSFLGNASDPFVKTFTVAIQLGAILSVVVLYSKQFLRSMGFYLKLFVAFIPAAVAGFIFGDVIDSLLERVDVVGYSLIGGGLFLLYVDRLFRVTGVQGESEVRYETAFRIGLFQVIALIPGISRSAATIIGGLFQKLNKKAAAEFSFFLAVPTMFAATLYKMLVFYKEGHLLGTNEWGILAVGNLGAFLVAILAIRTFIKFLTNHGFKWFGVYRIVIGVIILSLYYSGIALSTL